MRSHWQLILLLTVILTGDALFNVALIWTVVEKGESKLVLGIVLAFETLIPFGLQHVARRWIARQPARTFFALNAFGIAFSIFGLLISSRSTVTLYMFAALFSLLTFFTQQLVEAIVAIKVVEGVDANVGAKILQVSVQTGALAGAALAGVLLQVGGLNAVFLANLLPYALGLTIVAWLRHKEIPEDEQFASAPSGSGERLPRAVGLCAMAGLLISAVQVGSFNFLLPILAQSDKHWSAADFGFIDAFAGIGAFAAVAIPKNSLVARAWFLSFVLIGTIDILFQHVNDARVFYVAGALLGLSVNLLRIRHREVLYRTIRTRADAARMSANLTLTMIAARSLSPLLLALLTTQTAGEVFQFLGISMILLLGGLQLVESSVRRRAGLGAQPPAVHGAERD